MRNHAFRADGWDELEYRVILSLDAVTPAQRLDNAAVQRHADDLAQVSAGRASNILFLGDSITARWGLDNGAGVPVWDSSIVPLGAADFGLDGDRTQNLLWRLRDGE